MSKKSVLAVGVNAFVGDGAGQVKAVKMISDAKLY